MQYLVSLLFVGQVAQMVVFGQVTSSPTSTSDEISYPESKTQEKHGIDSVMQFPATGAGVLSLAIARLPSIYPGYVDTVPPSGPAGFGYGVAAGPLLADVGGVGAGNVISQKVEVVKPIPVPIVKTIPVAVPHPVPISVPHPIPVSVPHPVPVHIPVPVPVIKREPVPIVRPVPVPILRPYPVPIEKKVPVPVPKPYPVPVPVYKIRHIYHVHAPHGHF